ncbi:ankyrin repeat domain-containing protein [Desulfosarcina ovata]|uniref:Peptidase M48 domain-containing protein n=1 Tax=Desulfosarcina ovata subsp. ovata TaxID=2752305 RepID=A0A5K8A9Y2_9BACT|nr:ankyrin repeat domain-containing protein [Desulfosarcina ovata]BBO89306.1 hypothetical protein DSCOOX_24860 [Desulfosarcina ovata subsp. ovata]
MKHIRLLIIIILILTCYNIESPIADEELNVFKAVLSDDLQSLKKLIDDHVNISQMNENGETPLHIAAERGNLNIAIALITAGANVNSTDNTNRTPLFIAVNNEYIDLIKLLIVKNANVNKSLNNGNSPLHNACIHGNILIVKLLLSNGANLNSKNSEGHTPLFLAEKHENYDVVDFLENKKNEITYERFKNSYDKYNKLKEPVELDEITKKNEDSFSHSNNSKSTQRNSPYEPKTKEEREKYNRIFNDILNNPDINSYINSVKNKLTPFTKSQSDYKIRISKSTYVNGWSQSSNLITITRGMLHTIFNEDELACFISHEIGHAELNHLWEGGTWQDKEKEADIYAIALCLQAGYQPYAYADLLNRLAQLVDKQAVWKAEGKNRSHPPLIERAELIRKFLLQKQYVDSFKRRERRYQQNLAVLHDLAEFMDDAVRSDRPLWPKIYSDKKITGPDFLGPHSREALENINERLRFIGGLEKSLIWAPLVEFFASPVLVTGAKRGYPLEQQANSIGVLPDIVKKVIANGINDLMCMYGNDLSAEEQGYWEGIYDVLYFQND